MYYEFLDVEGGEVKPSKPKNKPDTNIRVEKLSGEYVATDDDINVRPTNSTNNDPIGTIDKGDKVTVTGKTGTWLQIEYKGKKAYVAAEYFKKIEDKKPSPKVKEPAKPTEPAGGVEKTKKMYLKQDVKGKYLPMMYSNDKAVFKKGEEIREEQRRGKWIKISSKQDTMWILEDRFNIEFK